MEGQSPDQAVGSGAEPLSDRAVLMHRPPHLHGSQTSTPTTGPALSLTHPLTRSPQGLAQQWVLGCLVLQAPHSHGVYILVGGVDKIPAGKSNKIVTHQKMHSKENAQDTAGERQGTHRPAGHRGDKPGRVARPHTSMGLGPTLMASWGDGPTEAQGEADTTEQ